MSPHKEERHGTPGRRDYDEIAKNVNEFVHDTKNRFERWFRVALAVIAFIAILTAGAIFGFGIILREQGDQQDQLQQQADLIADQALQIQQQRRDSIQDECARTNKRHDGAVAALVAGSDIDQKNAPDEAARKEIRRRRDVTIALLDALAPHEDCKKLVARSVQTVKPTETGGK